MSNPSFLLGMDRCPNCGRTFGKVFPFSDMSEISVNGSVCTWIGVGFGIPEGKQLVFVHSTNSGKTIDMEQTTLRDYGFIPRNQQRLDKMHKQHTWKRQPRL